MYYSTGLANEKETRVEGDPHTFSGFKQRTSDIEHMFELIPNDNKDMKEKTSSLKWYYYTAWSVKRN